MATIFIVDDEAPLLRILRIVLRDEFEDRHSVQTFTNPAHVLEVLRDYRAENIPLPDVILSDGDMPGMNGMKFHASLMDEGYLKNTLFALWSGNIDRYEIYCVKENIPHAEKGGGIEDILKFLRPLLGE